MSDPITAQQFMAGLSCNSGTRDPLPSKLPPPEVLVPHLWDKALLVTEIADLRAQLADADRTLAGFVRAVREARECIVAIRTDAKFLETCVYDQDVLNGGIGSIIARCDSWLTPAIAALPPARVLSEEGQS